MTGKTRSRATVRTRWTLMLLLGGQPLCQVLCPSSHPGCLEIEILKLTNVPAGGRLLRQVPPFDLPSHCFRLCVYVTGNLHNDKLSVHTAAVLRHVLRCGPCLQALKLATAMMMLSQTGQMRMRMRTWRSVIDTGCE